MGKSPPNVSDRAEAVRLAEEQAALRRVATLVAGRAGPDEVFEAVAAEVARLLGSDFALVGRYEPDATLTHVASHPLELLTQLGPQTALDGDDLASVVQRSGRPTCIDYDNAPGPVAALARELGVRCAVGAPIVVDDRMWGVMAVGWARPRRASLGAAERTAEFTELVATALANTESRNEITRLAEEQAALRRVATLVARGAPGVEVFDAVVTEIGQLFPEANAAALSRYELDGTLTMIGRWSSAEGYVPIGERYPLTRGTVGWLIAETRRPGRVTVDSEGLRSLPDAIRGLGWHSVVGAPIVVEDRLWGLVGISSVGERALPPDTEARLAQFCELVATAIANAESRAELAASRARVIATADTTRRRIERDLHDGAQQHLVSLALELRAAESAVPLELGDLRAELSGVAEGLASVIEELREIALGIHPAILAEGGLRVALKTLARRSSIAVILDVRVDRRMPESVEVAAYYVVAEALTNAAKHAQASVVNVSVGAREHLLRVSVRDDGSGGADPSHGSGLLGLKDRVESIDGTLSIESVHGQGTLIQVDLPFDGDAPDNADAHDGRA